MKVIPTQERGRFWVESENNKSKVYLVDMCAEESSYGCECGDYTYKISKEVEHGNVKPYDKGACCKHQEAVLRYIGVQYCKMNYYE